MLEQSSKKSQQFAISIRRKQVSQKLQALRSQISLQNQPINPDKYLALIPKIASQQIAIQSHLPQLKILSFNANSANALVSSYIHILLSNYLIQKQKIASSSASTTPPSSAQKQSPSQSQSQPQPQQPQQQQSLPLPLPLSTSQYNQILTIFINLCVHIPITQLNLPNELIQIVTRCILKPERQVITLWFLANIIYQRTEYSILLAKELVESCDVVEYMEQRIKTKGKFDNQGDIVIFNFFACSFLVVSGPIPAEKVKKIYEIVQEILKYQQKSQENYWFLSEALVDHGAYIGNADYQLFGTSIMKKFEYFVKAKKSKYIKNSLKMFVSFTSHDKLAYQKLLKYQIFTILSICLQNRFPQIKKLCAEIALNLLTMNPEKVDIQNIAFFPALSLQLLSLQKYTLDIQISILSYLYKFFQISASNCMSAPLRQKFITDILQTNALKILINVMVNNSTNNGQLLNQIINLLELLMKIDENKRIIKKIYEQNRGLEYLRNVAARGSMASNGMMNNGESGVNQKVYQHVCAFLGNFKH